MVRFHALGSVTISEHDRELAVGGPRQRRLLAMLLIHRNAVVSVDRLADVVFDGDPTPAASTTLRSYVARVRRVIDGAPGIGVVTRAPGYQFQLPDDAFDVARFEAMAGEARGLASRGDAIGAASVLCEALGHWRGDACAEFADEEWAQPEAQRLGELRLAAQEDLFGAELSCGRAADLVPEIEALARQHPLREGVWAQLMLALYRAGRHADALRAFQDHRTAMVEELGLDPGPALRELEERILAHDPELLVQEPAGTPLRGYRLGERLGTGHDGTVCVAHLPGVEREIVMRLVRSELVDAPDFVSNRDSRNGLFGVAFSPDGDRLMTGDGAITAVTVWDVSPLGGAELANFANAAGSRGSFTPEGELLVSAPGGGVAIWDLEEGSPRLEIDTRAVVRDDVYEMALSPDGELLATSAGGLPIELWDAETGEHHRSVAPDGLDAWVEDLSWSPDGQHLALGLGLFNTVDAGESVRTVADFLVHADPGFTLRVYAHLLPASQDRARRIVGQVLGGGPVPGSPRRFQSGSPSRSLRGS